MHRHIPAGLAGLAILAVGALVSAAEPMFRAQTIDDKIEIGYGVATADVDGDKKVDILVADKRQFVWYRNPTWEKFLIAENLTERDNVCLAAQDIDGDGKCELAVGADWAPADRETSGAVFYLIPPEDRTQKWEAVKLHAEPTVHRMRWMKIAGASFGLVVAPLHGKGKEGFAGSKILLYHKPADVRSPWKTEVLDDQLHATHNFDLVQASGLLVASAEGVFGISRKAPGDVTSIRLPNSQPAGEVRIGSRGPTGQLIATIEPMHGNQLVAYKARQRKVITDKLIEGHALAIGKLTSQEDEIVAGWRGGGGGVRLFTPIDPAGTAWRENVIDDKDMACEDLCLADLNVDGKLDIIASGRATKNVKIYWNSAGQ